MKNKFRGVSERVADKSMEFLMQKPHIADLNSIQYANFNHVRSMFLFSDKILSHLKTDQTYINIGTGFGFLEYTNKKYHKLKLKTCDLPPTVIDPLYTRMRKHLGVEVDYDLGFMKNKDGTDLTIKGFDPFNDYTRWNTAIFIRFVPLRNTLISKQNIENFNKHMKKYVDNIIIYTVKDKTYYPNLDLFSDSIIKNINDSNGVTIEYPI
tara:strand:- start:261 stop:887 length:627 start_codon:yes stop_codon:yes gene_type:complete